MLRLATELMLREQRAQQFGCFAQDDRKCRSFDSPPALVLRQQRAQGAAGSLRMTAG